MLIVLSIALLLATTTGASAAFLVPIVASTLAVSEFTAGLIVTAGAFTASYGVNYVAQKLIGRSSDPQASPSGGAQLDIRIAADVPESLLVGRAVTAGSRVHAATYGASGTAQNANLVEITALADHPCTALHAVFVEGKLRTLQADDGYRGRVVDDYNSKIALKFYDGTQTSADDFAVDKLGDDPDAPWTTDHIGTGRCYVRQHGIYGPNLVPGPLEWKFVVDGIKLYDPRLDSSAGGSGEHRFDDLSTHAWTQNIPVIVYNILRGIYVLNSTNERTFFYGLENTTADQFPLENWFAAMNAADEAIALEGGGTEPQFIAGGEITTDTEPLDAIKSFLLACGGRLSELGGVYELFVGAPGLPKLSITDGDILASREDRFRPVLTLEQRINHITAKYISPSDGWIEAVAPPRSNPEWEAEDGRQKSVPLDLTMVQSGTQAQRLQEQYLNRSRRGRQHVLPLPPYCAVLRPGDIFEWNSDRNGYVDKLFEVDSVGYHADLCCDVTCTEVDPTDYDWSTSNELPIPDGLLPTARPDPKVVGGFGVAAILHLGDAGTQRPAIRLTWDDPEDGDATGIAYEIRVSADHSNISSYSTTEDGVVARGALDIIGGLQALTEYDVRARFLSFNGYASDWSLWETIETPDTRITSAELIPSLADMIDAGGEADEIVRMLLAAQSSVSTTRDLALRSGYIEPQWFELFDQIGNTALELALRAQETRDTLAEIGVSQSGGRYVIAGVEKLNDDVRTVNLTLDAHAALISLSATQTDLDSAIAAATAQLQPAVTWSWNGTDEGWTGTNGTLTAGAGYISFAATSSGAYIQSPTISIDADANGIVRFTVQRTAGSGWGVTLKWGASFVNSLAYAEPGGAETGVTIAFDLRAEPTWTGTITAIRVTVDNGTTLKFSYGQIGSDSAATILLDSLQGQINNVNVELDAVADTITLKADQTVVDGIDDRLTVAEGEIVVQAGEIDARALQVDLDDTDTRVTTAEQTISALTGTISQVLQTTSDEYAGIGALTDALNAELAGARAAERAARAETTVNVRITEQGEVIASQIDALTVVSNANTAAIVTEQTTRAAADSAEASLRTTLANEVHDGTTGLATKASSVALTALQNLSDGSTLATKVSSLDSSVNNVSTGLATKAAASDLTSLKNLSDGSTLATKVTSLDSSVNNVSTGLATKAAASDLTSLKNLADGSTLATKVSSLDSSVNNVSTGLATKAAASDLTSLKNLSDGSTLATKVSSLDATVNTPTTGLSAKVTINTSAISTLQGYASAAIGVTLDVNNYITGVQQINQGTPGSSYFDIVADRLRLAQPGVNGGSPINIMEVGNVSGSPALVMKGAVIADEVIVLRTIQPGAAQEIWTSVMAGGRKNGSDVEIGALTMTCEVGLVDFFVSVGILDIFSGPHQILLKIYLDNVLILQTYARTSGGTGNATYPYQFPSHITFSWAVADISLGDHAVSFRIDTDGVAMTVDGPYLRAHEIRR